MSQAYVANATLLSHKKAYNKHRGFNGKSVPYITSKVSSKRSCD